MRQYTAEVARQRFLQMPLVCIVVGYQKSGQSLSYLIENYSDMNYQGIFQLLMTHKESSDPTHISKSALKSILSIAQSRREREIICYTAVVSGHHSQTSAKRHLGLHNMNKRISDVEMCITEAKQIRETIEDMAQTEIDGLVDNYTNDSSDEQCYMIRLLKECNFNWFEMVDRLKKKSSYLINYLHFMKTYLPIFLMKGSCN